MADTHAHTTSIGQAEPGHKTGFPPLDPGTFAPQLFWLALTFVLLYVLLKRTALPRVGEVIEERRDRIERDIAKAESLKTETELALTSYERALSEARARANAVAKDMNAKLTAEVDAERSRLDTQIAQQIADAEALIGQEKARAMAGIARIAGDTAGAIVAKLIGKEASPDEVRRALMQRAAE
ncbi:MAG: F0F1 ATP synthase subunit B' [Hyphomicrobiaceae bacterium]|nr:F0F1 ATP synthase subunit B' [Hyphomicrobiaceae bacterium]